MLKREISKTDNNLFRSRTYTRVPRPATVALCGEIAPFNYADQSSPPPPSPAGPVQVHSNASDPDGPAILMRASAIWSINTEVMESRGYAFEEGGREREHECNFYLLRMFNRRGLTAQGTARDFFPFLPFLSKGENKDGRGLRAAPTWRGKNNR